MIETTRTLKSVEVLPEQDAVNVCWVKRVYEDGVLIAEPLEPQSYTRDRKDAFLADVTGAANYVAALGW